MWVTDPITGRRRARKSRRHFDSENTPCELTFSCYQGYAFFARERTRKWFVDAIEEARQKFSIDLWAWVIMPEHVHLIVMPREQTIKVGKFQGFVKERVARQSIPLAPRVRSRVDASHHGPRRDTLAAPFLAAWRRI